MFSCLIDLGAYKDALSETIVDFISDKYVFLLYIRLTSSKTFKAVNRAPIDSLNN